MTDATSSAIRVVLVDETVRFTLVEFCHACRADAAEVTALVHEGVLEPMGEGPADWQFEGPALRRARTALRLTRDLDLNPAATALVLDLLGQIEALRSALGSTR